MFNSFCNLDSIQADILARTTFYYLAGYTAYKFLDSHKCTMWEKVLLNPNENKTNDYLLFTSFKVSSKNPFFKPETF